MSRSYRPRHAPRACMPAPVRASTRPSACLIVLYYAPANQLCHPSCLCHAACPIFSLASTYRLLPSLRDMYCPSRPHVWIRFRHPCVRAAIRMPAVSDHVPSLSHSAPAYSHPSTPDALGQRLRWARAAPHCSTPLHQAQQRRWYCMLWESIRVGSRHFRSPRGFFPEGSLFVSLRATGYLLTRAACLLSVRLLIGRFAS